MRAGQCLCLHQTSLAFFRPAGYARQAKLCTRSAGGAMQQNPGRKSPRQRVLEPWVSKEKRGLSPETAEQVACVALSGLLSPHLQPRAAAASRPRPGLCCAAPSALGITSLSWTRMPFRALDLLPIRSQNSRPGLGRATPAGFCIQDSKGVHSSAPHSPERHERQATLCTRSAGGAMQQSPGRRSPRQRALEPWVSN